MSRYDQTKTTLVRLNVALTDEHRAAIARLYGKGGQADDATVRDWAEEALLDALKEALAEHQMNAAKESVPAPDAPSLAGLTPRALQSLQRVRRR